MPAVPSSPTRSATHPMDFTAYRTAVMDSVVPLELRAQRPDEFRGRLDPGGAGDIHVFDVAADGHAVHRSSALIARERTLHVKFTLLLEGRGMLVQAGRETTLGPGTMAIYDTDRPYSLLFDDRMRMGVLMFPRCLLDVAPQAVAELSARRFDGATGVGAVVRAYLTQMFLHSGQLDVHLTRRLARSAVDLIGTLLETHRGDRPTANGHETLMRRIYDYIEEHLSSPDLDPARIAGAHFISVRHLHGLFRGQGTSVSTTVRTRRLERCYDELVDPRRGGVSVTAIASQNGFRDPAHFSRAFRARYGVPPSAVRPTD